MKKIPDKDKLLLIDQLEQNGMFFKKFWSISDVYWTESIPTAAVTSTNDKIQFLFNKDFWETLSPRGRLFVICHEQLHLLNNHFVRLRFQDGNSQIKNIAADVAINEMLVRNYSFEKTDLPDTEQWCWLDTVFKDDTRPISNNETAEFYYSLLVARQEQEQQKLNELLEQMLADGTLTDAIKEAMQADVDGMYDGVSTVDDHQFSQDNQDLLSKEVREAIEDALEEFEGNNPDSAEAAQAGKRIAYRKAKKAGNKFGANTRMFDVPIAKKKHWKKLYKSICKSIFAATSSEHWAFQDNKFALLPSSCDLPGTYIQDKIRKTKVVVYLDVSGSCVEDTKLFLQTAMSLPRDQFVVKYYTFDTEIRAISHKPPFQINGGGGTSFECIRNHVENELDYYDAIFVFTDGEASRVSAERPTRWFWFITPSGNHDSITPNSKSFNLNDFGWADAMAKNNERNSR